MREFLETAIKDRLSEHQEAHAKSIEAWKQAKKGKKAAHDHPCEEKPCAVCRGEGMPCGCGAPSENAAPCHACGGRGTFVGASLVCDACGGAQARAGGPPCEACQGSGTKASEAVYTEGGVLYPFQVRDVFRHPDGLRVSGTVDIPGQPTFRRRTRQNLPYADTPAEGCVSPPGELKKEASPAEDATIAEPLSEKDTAPETFLGMPLELSHEQTKPRHKKRGKHD